MLLHYRLVEKIGEGGILDRWGDADIPVVGIADARKQLAAL